TTSRRRPLGSGAEALLLDEAVDGAVLGGDVDVVGVVFAEGGGGGDGEAQFVVGGGAMEVGGEGAELALAVVGVDVAAAEGGGGRVGDDVAADHRATAIAGVGVGEDRFGRAAGVGRPRVFVGVGGAALEGVPAEVRAAGRGDRRVVDLLEAVLADVADREPRAARIGDQ